MLAKKAFVLYAPKLIYILLIIWVGGLAPLIYFENYSSHRGVQRVKVSLLQEPEIGKLPAAFRQMWTERSEWPPRGLYTRSQFIARNISLPGIRSSAKIFRDGCLLTKTHTANLPGTSSSESVSVIQLTGSSVWLPPPEKPPPLPVRLS